MAEGDCDWSFTAGGDWSSAKFIFRGNLIVPTESPFAESAKQQQTSSSDCLWLGPGIKIVLDHIVVVDQKGIIVEILPAHQCDVNSFAHLAQYVQLDDRLEFLCPGLIDLHIHAPQYSYTGTATDKPLMGKDGWLESYTFPAEQRLASDDHLQSAQQVYQHVVQTTLRNGTTTAVYFGSLHLEPCKVLVDTCLKHGQRSLVGKVCMDRNVDYKDYCHSVRQNVDEARELIDYIHQRAGRQCQPQQQKGPTQQQQQKSVLPLVLPVVTPRFIPTCSAPLLSALGTLAAQHNCHITSHLSESYDEVEYSQQLDVELLIEQQQSADNNGTSSSKSEVIGRTDAQVFCAHGLLQPHSIMAHSVHLTKSDVKLFRDNEAAIAHCPLSNFFFAGKILPCKKLLKEGVHIGLGTDVAGGYSPSMWNASRMAVLASHALQQQQQHDDDDDDDDAILDYRHAFYLATLGGARALGLADCIGTLKVGMEWDALLLTANSAKKFSPVHVFETDSLADIFQKICLLGDDRNIKRYLCKEKKLLFCELLI